MIIIIITIIIIVVVGIIINICVLLAKMHLLQIYGAVRISLEAPYAGRVLFFTVLMAPLCHFLTDRDQKAYLTRTKNRVTTATRV